MHYVIIGAGPAGVTAAENLRKFDRDAKISIIGDEKEPPYSRMALPYLLMNKIGESGSHLRKSPDHFTKLAINVMQQRVIALKADDKQLLLGGGDTLQYDKLLIATGSHPVKLAMPGIDLPGVLNCWTLADARQISQRVRKGARVVLLGAGFIGCIILEALVKSGAQLTVVEIGDRMVPRMMNEKAGALIKAWCVAKGVIVYTQTRITSVQRNACGTALLVKLDTGVYLAADVLVSAAGVKANIEFLQSSGIQTDDGILVDRHLQTNIADIYAAGDVAQGLDFSTDDYSVQAIQPTAVDHGLLAAKNMVGFREVINHGNINMNVLDTLGLIACSFGLWRGVDGGESVERCHPEGFQYINLQFADDVLVGATAIGLTQHVGVLRGLIQSKIRLGVWKQRLLQDPTRIMEAYIGSTQALGFNAPVL